MIASGPSGFYNAPTLKAIALVITGTSLVVSIFGGKRLPNSPHELQFWRLFPNSLLFSSPMESALGVLYLYHFRILERQMGSAKFAVFAFSMWILNNLIILIFTMLFPFIGAAAGPYWLIYSLLVQYYFEVPSTYRFRLFGIHAGDKLLTYLLSLQLIGIQFPASLLASLSGIIAGMIYKSDAMPISRAKLPAVLIQIAQRWLLPILQHPPRHTPLNVNLRNLQQQAGVQPQRAEMPPDSSVAVLMDMGFSREEAYGALTHTNNDPQLAAALLLDRH